MRHRHRKEAGKRRIQLRREGTKQEKAIRRKAEVKKRCLARRRKLKIGWDLHDTYVDRRPALRRMANSLIKEKEQKLPLHLLQKDIRVMRAVLGHRYRKLNDVMMEQPQWFRCIESFPNAKDVARRLYEDGHELRVITGSDDEAFLTAIDWSNFREELQSGRVVLIGSGRRRSRTRHARRKATKRGPATGLDVFMDNRIEVLQTLRGVVPHLILFDPSNSAHPPNWVIRVTTWLEFERVVEDLATQVAA